MNGIDIVLINPGNRRQVYQDLGADIAGKICSALHEQTAAKVAIGGLHPSALPQQTLEEEDVDFVVDGEGPLTLKSLLTAIKTNSGRYANIPGLWYQDNGIVRHSQRAPLLEDLDNMLPLAAWD